MTSGQAHPEPGGFMPPTGLPSPAPSSACTARPSNSLPHPRNHSLRPGSSKEDLVRRYVEDKLLTISRRYVKKFGQPLPGDDIVGFRAFSQVARELEGLVDVLWKSGTPSLQIPFLLRIASDLTQYVSSFPPSPRSAFELLGKLDHCFASLLHGQDIDTEEQLPGFENGLRAGMTVTEMVRCRSLVEQTRILMVEILSTRGGPHEEQDDDADQETDPDGDSEGDGGGGGGGGDYRAAVSWDVDEERLHMDAARIYEMTLIQLGERLGDPMGSEIQVDTSTVCST